MHRKFNDDIFARCLVIMKNVVISYIKDYNMTVWILREMTSIFPWQRA